MMLCDDDWLERDYLATCLAERRYRPEQHYMRGPGPKWFERHRR